jgi:hypothetical protein
MNTGKREIFTEKDFTTKEINGFKGLPQRRGGRREGLSGLFYLWKCRCSCGELIHLILVLNSF